MTNISPGLLIVLYLIGWIPMLYLGARMCDRMWRRVMRDKIVSAYSRGWNHGFGFLQKIDTIKTEQISGVTILAERADSQEMHRL